MSYTTIPNQHLPFLLPEYFLPQERSHTNGTRRWIFLQCEFTDSSKNEAGGRHVVLSTLLTSAHLRHVCAAPDPGGSKTGSF